MERRRMHGKAAVQKAPLPARDAVGSLAERRAAKKPQKVKSTRRWQNKYPQRKCCATSGVPGHVPCAPLKRTYAREARCRLRVYRRVAKR